MEVLSVICARAGSQGLNNKCIAKIDDKMVVEYSIEYSLSLGENVKTVISTDIEVLIDYCIKNNINYIRRDPKLCTNESKIEDALADAIEKEGGDCQYCSLVQGNVPTRYNSIFSEALNFLRENKDFDCVITMQNVEKFHPQWMFDYRQDILPKKRADNYRRQMLPLMMIHDAHTLIFEAEQFLKRYKGLTSFDGSMYSIYGGKIKPLITKERIIDIDTGLDLENAKSFILGKKHGLI